MKYSAIAADDGGDKIVRTRDEVDVGRDEVVRDGRKTGYGGEQYVAATKLMMDGGSCVGGRT
jgi:hypothetical protein